MLKNLIILMLLIVLNCQGDDVKKRIAQYQIELTTSTDKGECYKNLAIAYYQDQDQEAAFEAFLKALEHVSFVDAVPSVEEKKAFDEVLPLYLENPQRNASKILEKCRNSKENDHLVGFLIASSYANQRKFPDFFERFYASYIHYPEHFLSYKTQAVLHIKLYERSRTEQRRELQRELIVENIANAIELFPQDVSLYKIIMVYSPEKKKKELVHTYLNKIINHNIIVPRTDIAFYVKQALAVQQPELGQRFINQAREWYQYSRAIEQAQQYLK